MGRRKKIVFDVDEDTDEEQQQQQHLEVGRGNRNDDDDDSVVNEGDYEDDDDDEEGEDEFEDDGFIVNDYEEEEVEEQNDVARTQKHRKKRKRKSLKSFILDDDDFELIRENAGNFHQPNKETTKFKRIKKVGRDSTDDEGMQFEDEIEGEEEYMSGSGEEEDEMANFIVDEENTIYENRAPIRERKPKKKKKQREALGVRVTSSESVGGHYLYGDADELLKLRKQAQATSHKSDDMSGFDPVIQTEEYMNEKDNLVHEIDIPERMQIYEGITGHDSVEQLSLEEESSWILNQLATNMFPLFHEKRVVEGIDEAPYLVEQINKEDIVRFLKLHHVEKYDIPFIAMYRKEQCRSLLKNLEQLEAGNEDKDVSEGTRKLKWHRVLWAVKELHRKWMLLQKRKIALLQYYYKHYEQEFHNNRDKTMFTSSHQLFESVITSLRNAETEKDIDDVDMKFSLHFPPVEVSVDEGLFRRPKRRSKYYDCVKADLWKVARKFGCDSEQFGLQVTLQKVRMDMLDEPRESPMEVALNFTCAMFTTPEAVLKGARHMAALEISCEPCFRRHVRSLFLDKALVSTSPTPEGNRAIDSFHQFAKVKWLREKPLIQFLDAQWLLIQKAEEEKLLQVSLKLPDSTLNELKTHAHDCYLGDGLIESGRLWNEQRRFILEDAFLNYLFPSMEKEARNVLTARAKKWLLMEYGKQLWSRVSVAPYRRKENNVAALDEETAPRVMACCWGPGKPPTTFVMLDSMGELIDVLHAGYLSSRSQNVNDQQRKKSDQHNLLKFLRNHQPHVVVLGAANWSSTRLKDDISEIICQMEENPRIDIVYGDVLLPQLYEHSQISSEQLPGKPGIAKRAVALGRYLQNPLAMIATLCDTGREITNWNLSSLDHFLPSEEKYEMIEQVMVDVTNQVGFDINLAVNHEWAYAPLQFISGLGSQKAASIKKALVGARELKNRTELTGCGLRTKNIFHNSVGFLQVHYNNLLAISTDINILDDTRIHPESYRLAEDLAKAVHKCYVQDDTDNDVFQELVVENLRANPNLLKGFDVNEYADDYEKEKGENRIETLSDIKAELQHGFQDPRKAYKEPTQDEEFLMISGGSRDMLAEGRFVQATVRRVLPQRAICVLVAGLTGILSKDNFSDHGDDFDLTDKVHEGDSLACKIKQIEKSKYLVFLSCKESDLNSNPNQDFQDADPYYCEGWSNSLSLQDKPHNEKELAVKHFTPRTIFHPRFHNMTMNEALKFLSDKEAGECIFRPSLRGVYYLTLTLKVYNGVYAHKDIIEDGKDQSNLTSLLRLGRLLKIGDDEFGNLDEVMEQYVRPLVAHLKAMLSFGKFKRGSKAEIDDMLRAEKADYPMRIAYCFSISHEHPGTFILSYIRDVGPHHNYVGLHPKGFKFRKHTFDNIDHVVAYFQKYTDKLQNTPMVPVTGPHSRVSSPYASLGCGRGSNDSAWGSHTNLDNDKPITPFFKGKDDDKDGFSGERQSSGLPKPYGGRGHGSYNNKGDNNGKDRKDFGYDTKRWGSFSTDGFEGNDGLSNFPGAKEDIDVGGGHGRTDGSDAGNWGGSGGSDRWGGSSWGGSDTGGQAGGCGSGDNQGGRGGRGRGQGRDRGRGRERGRGRGSFGDCNNRGNYTNDSNYSTSTWGSDFNGEGGGIKGWSSSSGTEVQKGSSGKWDSNGNGNSGNGNWGSGGSSAGGWCGSSVGKEAGGGFCDGSRGRGNASAGNWSGLNNRGRGRGRDNGRGNGRGRGRGRGYCGDRGDNNGNDRKNSNYNNSNWSSDFNDKGGSIMGLSSFAGTEDQNGTFGKWDSNGSGNAGNGNWGGGGSSASGWCNNNKGKDGAGGIWDGNRGRGTARGGRSERGRGTWDGSRGRGTTRGGRSEHERGRGRGRGFGRNTGDWGSDNGADHANGSNWVGGGSGNTASGSGWAAGGDRGGW